MTDKKTTGGSVSVRETLTLSSGVVLECRAIATDVWVDALSKVSEPKPPTVLIESTGRYEENDSDPDYIAAKRAYHVKHNEASKRAAYVLGTRVLEVPADMARADSEEWAEERAFLGYSAPTKIDALYDWLRIKAAPSSADMVEIMRTVGRLTSTREQDVMEALKSA